MTSAMTPKLATPGKRMVGQRQDVTIDHAKVPTERAVARGYGAVKGSKPKIYAEGDHDANAKKARSHGKEGSKGEESA